MDNKSDDQLLIMQDNYVAKYLFEVPFISTKKEQELQELQ